MKILQEMKANPVSGPINSNSGNVILSIRFSHSLQINSKDFLLNHLKQAKPKGITIEN
jgi:hypothetical protein